MIKMSDKYYDFRIQFVTEKERDDFKNKINSLKIKTGKPIYWIATQMLYNFIKAGQK